MKDLIYRKVEDLPRIKVLIFTAILLAYIAIYVFMGISGNGEVGMILKIDKIQLLLIQGIASAVFFLLLPWLFLTFILGASKSLINVNLRMIGILFFIVLCNTFVMSVIIEWNIAIDLPNGVFENWAQKKEAELKQLTEYIIDFDGFGQFLLALAVMSILPALGEEILFRGLVQNFFRKILDNPHAAIWTSAILFSAIHLQFYGFVPRMLLGVVFGYLYLWSGKLSTAIWAHFFHNGLALTVVYATSHLISDEEKIDMEKSAPIYAVLLFLVLGIWGIIQFRKMCESDG